MPLLGDRDHHAHQCVGFEKEVSSPEDGYADMMNRRRDACSRRSGRIVCKWCLLFSVWQFGPYDFTCE